MTTIRSASIAGAIAWLVLLVAASHVTFAQTQAKRVVEVGDLKVSVPDVELINQDGKKVRFYSDLIKDRVVIVSFFFTSCEYVCTMQGSNFAALQQKLGDRLGRDVHLILLTRDPRTDTPAKLKAWGKRFGVRPGWTLLTGRAEDVESLLGAFTGDHVGPVEAHSSGIYLGNDAAAAWAYTSGLAPPEVLIKTLDKLGDKPRRL